MERRHLMIGLIAGMACFVTAIWTGLELREMMIVASERLPATQVDELAQGISSIHLANQALLWRCVLMIGFTVAGFLVSGIVLIAWCGMRIVAQQSGGDDLRGRSGTPLVPKRRSSRSMQIGGKRYLLR